MGKGIVLKKIAIPEVRVDLKPLDLFEGATGVCTRNYFEGRFSTTEKGIDGGDDVMVIGRGFDEAKMQITPDLSRNSGVKYTDRGVASEGERYLSSAPQSREEEVIELDESDLIFEPAPVFLSSVSEAQDLSHLFDLSDVGLFDAWSSPAPAPFSEISSSFRPEEDAWFVDPDSLSSQALPPFRTQSSEGIPQAIVVPRSQKNPLSGIAGIFRGMWNAWKRAAGGYPFLLMGFQFLLGGKNTMVVGLPEKVGTRLYFTNQEISSDYFQRIIQHPEFKDAQVALHRTADQLKILNYEGKVWIRRKITETATHEIPVPIIDGSGNSLVFSPTLNPATDALVINGVEIRFQEGS